MSLNSKIFDELVSSWLGTSYVHGGSSKRGIDCVYLPINFVQQYFEKIGSSKKVVVPAEILKDYDPQFFLRNVSQGFSWIDEACSTMPFLRRKILLPGKYPIKGDLLVFAQGVCPGGHMGISIDGEGNFIHSLVRRGVVSENLSSQRFNLKTTYSVDYSP